MDTQIKDARPDRRSILAGSVMFAFLIPLAKAARAAGLVPQVQGHQVSGRSIMVKNKLVKVLYYGGYDTFSITSNIKFTPEWGYSGVALIKFPDSKLALVELDPLEMKLTHVGTEIIVRPTELVSQIGRFAWDVNGTGDQYTTELEQLLHHPDPAFRRPVTSYSDESLRAWVAHYALSTLA